MLMGKIIMDFDKFIQKVKELLLNKAERYGYPADSLSARCLNDNCLGIYTNELLLAPPFPVDVWHKNSFSMQRCMELADGLSGSFAKMLSLKEHRALVLHQNIFYRLVNAKQYESILHLIPHKRILDLAVIYMVNISGCEEPSQALLFTHVLREELELTEEGLYEIACRNTCQIFPEKVYKAHGRYFLSSRDDRYCGSVLYPGVLKKISDTEDDALYIVPFSPEEFEVVPCKDVVFSDLKEGYELFRCEPRTTPLSDTIYLYKEGKLSFAEDDSSELVEITSAHCMPVALSMACVSEGQEPFVKGFFNPLEEWSYHASAVKESIKYPYLTVGMFAPDTNGCLGEFVLVWDDAGIRLKAYDDAWHIFKMLPELMELLDKISSEKKEPSIAEFSQMLLDLGFKDFTERK